MYSHANGDSGAHEALPHDSNRFTPYLSERQRKEIGQIGAFPLYATDTEMAPFSEADPEPTSEILSTADLQRLSTLIAKWEVPLDEIRVGSADSLVYERNSGGEFATFLRRADEEGEFHYCLTSERGKLDVLTERLLYLSDSAHARLPDSKELDSLLVTNGSFVYEAEKDKPYLIMNEPYAQRLQQTLSELRRQPPSESLLDQFQTTKERITAEDNVTMLDRIRSEATLLFSRQSGVSEAVKHISGTAGKQELEEDFAIITHKLELLLNHHPLNAATEVGAVDLSDRSGFTDEHRKAIRDFVKKLDPNDRRSQTLLYDTMPQLRQLGREYRLSVLSSAMHSRFGHSFKKEIAMKAVQSEIDARINQLKSSVEVGGTPTAQGSTLTSSKALSEDPRKLVAANAKVCIAIENLPIVSSFILNPTDPETSQVVYATDLRQTELSDFVTSSNRYYPDFIQLSLQ